MLCRHAVVALALVVGFAVPRLSLAERAATEGHVFSPAVITLVRDGTVQTVYEERARAEQSALCAYRHAGEQGQGLTGWVVPVVSGSRYQLTSLSGRFGVRFYPASAQCDRPGASLLGEPGIVPDGAGLGVVTLEMSLRAGFAPNYPSCLVPHHMPPSRPDWCVPPVAADVEGQPGSTFRFAEERA